ncbi:MAG: hypothetical protein LBD70_01625 [Bifidobacteriaceae bacterium]|nr:hypothetical protein [Bifidobacteriaceae bacterium]
MAAALNLEATPFSALVALPVDKTSDYVFDKLFPDLADDGGQAQVDSAPGNWFAYWRVRDAATQTDIRAH